MNGVTKISHNAARKTAGIGYVVLSSSQPREKYIANCYKNQLVNLITIEGEIIPNCLVGKGVWNYLTFPQTTSERGSCVAWVNVPYAERVVVVGVLNKRDEINEHFQENVFKLKRKTDQEHNVEIKGDGKQGILNVIVNGTESDEGQMVFKLLNANQQALFSVYVQGAVNFDVENKVDFRVGNEFTVVAKDFSNPSKSAKITYKLGEGFTLQDEHGNQITTKPNGIAHEVQNNSKVYNVAIGATGQPAVLGDNLADLLGENISLLKTLINTLDAVTQGPPGGPLPKDPFKLIVPALKLNLNNLEKKVKNIKAQNSNVS